MINRWDKRVYDFYMKDHPIHSKMNEDNQDAIYDLIHSVYKGINPTDENLDKVTSSPGFKLAAKSKRGRIDRTLNFVDKFWNAIENQDLDEDDVGGMDANKARIDNYFLSQEFSEDVKELNELEKEVDMVCGSYEAGVDEGDGEADVKARVNLMQQIQTNPRLKQILDMFGSIYSHMSSVSRTKLFPDATNVVDVKTGHNLFNLLQDELVKFAVPELEGLAMAQYATDSLLEFETGIEKDTGKGGLIIALDRSGSMGYGFDGKERYDVAIATTLAIAKMMDKLGRNCKVILFNDNSTEIKYDSFAELFDRLTKSQVKGGTRIVENISQIYQYADLAEDDIMLISDSEESRASASQIERLMKIKEDVGARLYSVILHYSMSYTVEEISDASILARSINDLKQFSEFAIRR